jgi:hypothetical protein
MPERRIVKKPWARYLVSDKDRHGNIRWYVRVPGHPKIRLTLAPGQDGFSAVYHDALAGRFSEKIEKHEPRPTGKYVYFLRCGDAVKIGYTTNPSGRLESLKTGLPTPIDAFVLVAGTEADERALHREFHQQRVHGEWFRANGALLNVICQVAAHGITRSPHLVKKPLTLVSGGTP